MLKNSKYLKRWSIMNIVVAPDSFKGSLTAKEVGITIQEALIAEIPHANVEVVPMADGGEGTLDSLVYSTKGKIIEVDVSGPYLNSKSTCYGVLGDNETVIIEIAKVVGLVDLPDGKKNLMEASSYGIGEMILHALDNGYRRFIIGLGGSATNDGGMGMLLALGAKFLDENLLAVKPIASSLQEIKTVDFSRIDSRIVDCNILIASDVENKLCGLEGASYVFGAQKGANQEQIKFLDSGLKHFGELIEEKLGKDLMDISGAGAAGGLGFAFLSLNADLNSGAKIVAAMTNLEEKIKVADLVITGEGQSDFQTLYGKAPIYVAKIAKKHHVKTLLISGSLGRGFEELYDYFMSVHSIVKGPISLEDAMNQAQQLLFEATKNIARLLKKLC